MVKEKVITSNLDLKILEYLKEERNVSDLLNEFEFGFSQCKRHIDRLERMIDKRKYGTFVFLKINPFGERVLHLFK
jgi:hypothetical protein